MGQMERELLFEERYEETSALGPTPQSKVAASHPRQTAEMLLPGEVKPASFLT